MIGMMEGMWAQYGIPEYGKDWSFASYPEEGDQETLRECEAFAARKTICQGLYLFGPPGRGKSGLAVSILKVFLEKQEPGLYIRWPQYLRHYQRRRLSAEEEKQMDLIYTVPCLVMDDLGVEPPTEASIRQLYELLEERRGRAGLYTVITSNYSLEELEQYWRPQGYGPGEFHDGLRVIERLSESYAELEVLGPNLRKSI
jgi:DNA replication protein DnaC